MLVGGPRSQTNIFAHLDSTSLTAACIYPIDWGERTRLFFIASTKENSMKAVHRTVRLPKADDERLATLCHLTGLTISEQLRELVRGARVVALVQLDEQYEKISDTASVLR